MPARNEDQHRIMVRVYAHGLHLSTMAVKMIEQANPVTIEAAIAWDTQFSGRQDAVTCLGLLRPGEEAMEIGPLGSSTAPRPPKPVPQSRPGTVDDESRQNGGDAESSVKSSSTPNAPTQPPQSITQLGRRWTTKML